MMCCMNKIWWYFYFSKLAAQVINSSIKNNLFIGYFIPYFHVFTWVYPLFVSWESPEQEFSNFQTPPMLMVYWRHLWWASGEQVEQGLDDCQWGASCSGSFYCKCLIHWRMASWKKSTRIHRLLETKHPLFYHISSWTLLEPCREVCLSLF